MPNLLRQCDIVCLPTRYGEGIPRILIEAAATGLASIVSGHPGCREIVEDGVTGRILSTTSDIEMSKEMSDAVTEYLASPNLLASHQQAAFRHFQSREFNQDAVVDRFTELLGFPLSPSRNRKDIALALQLLFLKISESMGNHDSKIVDADSVD